MFLQYLDEEERMKLLELLYKIACCDSEYAKEEKDLIRFYMGLWGISDIPDEHSIEQLIEYFAAKGALIQRIVWYECINMVQANGDIAEEEKQILNKVCDEFSVSFEDLKKIEKSAIRLQDVYFEVLKNVAGIE